MICPKCGYSESNHIQAKKSDKEHYLEFWGYTLGSPEAEQAWKEKEAEYAEIFANPYRAAERGFIDEVIFPEETRSKLISAFSMLENKVKTLPRKKHGNIPL